MNYDLVSDEWPTRGVRRAQYHRDYKALRGPVPLGEHGTVKAYKGYGCRCGPCTEANRVYVYQQRNEEAPVRVSRRTTDHWKAEARCRGMNPEVWFPDVGTKNAVAALKAICAECPVSAECLDYAYREGEREGVWGGLSPRERRTYRKVWLREQRESA